MISSVRYQNYKRFKDTSLDLSKRITILVGPNSSGKSSLIKGLLAFIQTYDDPQDHAGFVARGEYVDIGTFDEYVKDHDAHLDVSFSFEVTRSKPRGMIFESLRNNFFIKITHEKDPQTEHGRVKRYEIYLCSENSQNLSIKNFEDSPLRISFERMKKTEEEFRVDISKELIHHIISSTPRIKINDENDKTTTEHVYKETHIEKLIRYSKIRAKRDNKRGMSLFEFTEQETKRNYHYLIYFIEKMLLEISHSIFHDNITNDIYPIAPLREPPTRSAYRSDERQRVGARGQNTTSVYLHLKQRAIKAGSKDHATALDSLERLERWFKHLKLGSEIEISSWRDLVDMRTKSHKGKKSADSVVDVGVGFSQASPILVQLCAMHNASTLVVEQPELHLYPWAQTRLGEVLCEEAFRGNKRIILETHSEHIIQGIQLHVSNHRKNGKGLSSSDIQIIYVDEEANLRPIEMNEFGEFHSEWPDGFFDQTLNVYRKILENRQQ